MRLPLLTAQSQCCCSLDAVATCVGQRSASCRLRVDRLHRTNVSKQRLAFTWARRILICSLPRVSSALAVSFPSVFYLVFILCFPLPPQRYLFRIRAVTQTHHKTKLAPAFVPRRLTQDPLSLSSSSSSLSVRTSFRPSVRPSVRPCVRLSVSLQTYLLTYLLARLLARLPGERLIICKCHSRIRYDFRSSDFAKTTSLDRTASHPSRSKAGRPTRIQQPSVPQSIHPSILPMIFNFTRESRNISPLTFFSFLFFSKSQYCVFFCKVFPLSLSLSRPASPVASVDPSVYPSSRPSVYMHVYLYSYPSVCLSFCRSIMCTHTRISDDVMTHHALSI